MTLSSGNDAIAIFGAGGNLGQSITKLLPHSLFKVLVFGRSGRNSGPSDETTVNGTFDWCDLSKTDQISQVVERLLSHGRRIRYAIVCAGDGDFLGPLTDVSFYPERFEEQLFVNVISPLVVLSELFHSTWKHRVFPEQPASALVVSSLAGTRVFPDRGQGSYAASKAALNMCVRHLASELAPYYVNVNAVSPNSFPALIPTREVAIRSLNLLGSGLTGKILELDV